MRTLPAGDGVRLVRDVLIPMRDGTSLAADLYVPDGPAGGPDLPEQPLPVVMDYIPYRKDEVDPRAMRHYLELPRNGYIVARVDIRGHRRLGGRRRRRVRRPASRSTATTPSSGSPPSRGATATST